MNEKHAKIRKAELKSLAPLRQAFLVDEKTARGEKKIKIQEKKSKK